MHSLPFTIAAAQSSSVAGDIPRNISRHTRFVCIAHQHGANVVVFPELSLTGYEPSIAEESAMDLQDSRLDPLQALSNELSVAIIAGCPIRSQTTKPYLGAFIFRPREAPGVYRKRFLHPGEQRHFLASDDVVVCLCHGRTIGIAICADINNKVHPADAKKHDATVYAAGVAMTPNGIAEAEDCMSRYAKQYQFVAVMANYASSTGGFPMAGRSAAWDENGRLLAQAATSGQSIVLAESTSDGWRGSLVEMPPVERDLSAR